MLNEDGAEGVLVIGRTTFRRRGFIAWGHSMSGLGQADGDGVRWRRILFEGVVVASFRWFRVNSLILSIGRRQHSGAITFLEAPS